MIEIKDLLARFDSILFSEESKKELVRKIISEAIKVDIKSQEIKIQNSTIYLDIRPIYKNEILIKREKIDLALEQALGKKSPKDIR